MQKEEQGRTVKYAKFVSQPTNTNPEKFTLALSVNNPSYQGENFVAFVDLMNKYVTQINHLEILISCYLQHHYVGVEAADELLDKVLNEILPMLEKLDSRITLTIIPWRNLYSEKFNDTKKIIDDRYANNECFHKRVDNVAKSHAMENGIEAARNYTLEEATAMAVPDPSFKHLMYASANMPAPIKEVLNVYNKQTFFDGYSIFDVDPKKMQIKELKKQNRWKNNRDSNPSSDEDDLRNSPREKSVQEACVALQAAFKREGIDDPKEQKEIYWHFVRFFSPSEPRSSNLKGEAHENKNVRKFN